MRDFCVSQTCREAARRSAAPSVAVAGNKLRPLALSILWSLGCRLVAGLPLVGGPLRLRHRPLAPLLVARTVVVDVDVAFSSVLRPNRERVQADSEFTDHLLPPNQSAGEAERVQKSEDADDLLLSEGEREGKNLFLQKAGSLSFPSLPFPPLPAIDRVRKYQRKGRTGNQSKRQPLRQRHYHHQLER